MEHDPCPLPDDLATAHQLIRELAQTVRDQEQFIQKLQHQLEQLLRHRFGRKAETIDPDQLWLFAQEILAAAAAEPPSSPPPADTPAAAPQARPPRKNGHGRKPL